jgi:ppGpp synthetase/RelA/SpoT-type nucleotidyltranferase
LINPAIVQSPLNRDKAETATIRNAFSKTQIDRLGDRLKGGSHTESDLRLLDDYRRSFGEAYEAVLRTIRQHGKLPTGRLSKSTFSIVEKLRRESIRLSQMQDIAGCRVVVASVVEQEQFIASLRTVFPGASVIDRRDKPSYGYRAVHIIAEISGKPVEIQVRTALQHLWAEVSEKFSDVLDPAIKYGGGSDEWRSLLTSSSKAVASYERLENTYSKAAAAHEKLKKATAELLEHHAPDHEVQEMRRKLEDSTCSTEELRGEMVGLWNVNADLLNAEISLLDEIRPKGQNQ